MNPPLQPETTVTLDIRSGFLRIQAHAYDAPYRRYVSLRITTDSSYEEQGGYCPAESAGVSLSPEIRDKLIAALQSIDQHLEPKPQASRE